MIFLLIILETRLNVNVKQILKMPSIIFLIVYFLQADIHILIKLELFIRWVYMQF